MASVRARYGVSSDVGAFSILTNTYCLVPTVHPDHADHDVRSVGLYNVLESEIGDVLPIIPTTLANTRLVGTLAAGNVRGLLLPDNATDLELDLIETNVPDGVVVRKVEGEKLNALGNVVACNDRVAVVSRDLAGESVECIGDVLGVEVIRVPLTTEPQAHTATGATGGDGQQSEDDDEDEDEEELPISPSLIGSALVLNNAGGVISPTIPDSIRLQLQDLLDIPVTATTVNYGKQQVGAGIVANDFLAVIGAATWHSEQVVIEQVLGLAQEFVGTSMKKPNVLRYTGSIAQHGLV
ncbi:eukaryotic translation initiation factor 6 [Catenaria anguillulae PL171]|uniref:Eukaryotic translation initiation factor 6 n=1 Tax=Catenaria anguillulae PL171 TaxID=765915 RepID=A0A1Y2HRL5_9FUNG|nr:eukaryotic translation initiation factor 6 [Catenaria anguillulae PL171]